MVPRATRRLATLAVLTAIAGLVTALSVPAVPRILAVRDASAGTAPGAGWAAEPDTRRYRTKDGTRSDPPAPLLPPHADPAAPRPSGRPATDPPQPSTGRVWTDGGLVTRTTGKVFFTLDGSDYVCSGSVVDSANRDTVVTAGHCLAAGAGRFVSNWEFVPGYHDGQAPYGRWKARLLVVPPEWADAGDSAHDVGFAVVAPHGDRHLADVVGSQPIGFGPAPGWDLAFGYPVAAPYGGERLVGCEGPVRARGRTDGRAGPASQGLACGMTDGSSGGPWFTGFDRRAGRGTVRGVNSFGYTNAPGVLWSPVFGRPERRAYEVAQRS